MGRVTLVVAGTLPPLQVSKICDLIEGPSCSGAGHSASAEETEFACLKVTAIDTDLHFPVILSDPLPSACKWSLELTSECDDFFRKILHLKRMAHLQRSASESYSSNVLPPLGLERTSRLYAFKLMKNENENVRKLLPYFIEKSKTDEKYVPFRSRKLSSPKLESVKRRSDVCDVLMYRDAQPSKNYDVAPVDPADNETPQAIRLCGVPLGNCPITTESNLFYATRRSGSIRYSSPPASPLVSIEGSPSSSPQRRLVDRDGSVPPGTLPTASARARDSPSSAPPVAPYAVCHDAKNTYQGLSIKDPTLLQYLPSETPAFCTTVDRINTTHGDADNLINSNAAASQTGSAAETELLDVRFHSNDVASSTERDQLKIENSMESNESIDLTRSEVIEVPVKDSDDISLLTPSLLPVTSKHSYDLPSLPPHNALPNQECGISIGNGSSSPDGVQCEVLMVKDLQVNNELGEHNKNICTNSTTDARANILNVRDKCDEFSIHLDTEGQIDEASEVKIVNADESIKPKALVRFGQLQGYDILKPDVSSSVKNSEPTAAFQAELDKSIELKDVDASETKSSMCHDLVARDLEEVDVSKVSGYGEVLRDSCLRNDASQQNKINHSIMSFNIIEQRDSGNEMVCLSKVAEIDNTNFNPGKNPVVSPLVERKELACKKTLQESSLEDIESKNDGATLKLINIELLKSSQYESEDTNKHDFFKESINEQKHGGLDESLKFSALDSSAIERVLFIDEAPEVPQEDSLDNFNDLSIFMRQDKDPLHALDESNAMLRNRETFEKNKILTDDSGYLFGELDILPPYTSFTGVVVDQPDSQTIMPEMQFQADSCKPNEDIYESDFALIENDLSDILTLVDKVSRFGEIKENQVLTVTECTSATCVNAGEISVIPPNVIPNPEFPKNNQFDFSSLEDSMQTCQSIFDETNFERFMDIPTKESVVRDDHDFIHASFTTDDTEADLSYLDKDVMPIQDSLLDWTNVAVSDKRTELFLEDSKEISSITIPAAYTNVVVPDNATEFSLETNKDGSSSTTPVAYTKVAVPDHRTELLLEVSEDVSSGETSVAYTNVAVPDHRTELLIEMSEDVSSSTTPVAYTAAVLDKETELLMEVSEDVSSSTTPVAYANVAVPDHRTELLLEVSEDVSNGETSVDILKVGHGETLTDEWALPNNFVENSVTEDICLANDRSESKEAAYGSENSPLTDSTLDSSIIAPCNSFNVKTDAERDETSQLNEIISNQNLGQSDSSNNSIGDGKSNVPEVTAYTKLHSFNSSECSSSLCSKPVYPVTEPATNVTQTCHVSRLRKVCASDFNRGQALADRAAKIAQMHGASPSKPRPFAFPADVIRSQVARQIQPIQPPINECAESNTLRSKSASPMTQKRKKKETVAKRLRSTSPNNRLRISLFSEISELQDDVNPDEASNEFSKTEQTNGSREESSNLSFINTVYMRVPSSYDAKTDIQEMPSPPATYVSNFTQVTYCDVPCFDETKLTKTIRTEFKLPHLSVIEPIEKAEKDLKRWASYIANKILIEIFDFESPKWQKQFLEQLSCEDKTRQIDVETKGNTRNHCEYKIAQLLESPDSTSPLEDSLSSTHESLRKEAVTSTAHSASSADRGTGREEGSTSSSFSSEAWWSHGGPVTQREQLLPKEDPELGQQWPGLPVPTVPESDVDHTAAVSDEDFEAMDEDMRRLEEKIRQFEHELEEDLEISLLVENTHKMPNFSLLDKSTLRSSPLPDNYPPVCMKKTKHFSFMTIKDVEEYLRSDSESESSSSSLSSDDLFFAKRKLKLKIGDRRCFSVDLSKRSTIDDCKSECLMKILSISKGNQDKATIQETLDDSAAEQNEKTANCPVQNGFKLVGQYWRSEDGVAVLDSEGLAEFYAGTNPSGVCFIFEDESDDEIFYDEAIDDVCDSSNIPREEPATELSSNFDPGTPSIEENPSKPVRKSKFVSSFKNSFVNATKSIGPKFSAKLEENSSSPPHSDPSGTSYLSKEPSSFISDFLSSKIKPKGMQNKAIDVVGEFATLPASSGESDACNSSIVSGEYLASPAVCVFSDEDNRVPEYNLFQPPPSHDAICRQSSLAAPSPPVRKSSLDAVVPGSSGTFRRPSGVVHENLARHMVSGVPRALPTPPSVPPRSTTLNFYPIRTSGPRPPQSGS
ncbi:uncharacterized protein LOC108665248 isoform X2 [Hyalella azteca]|uniref:Uncharacterized protein LOC108665248 isoform X2 n=1 Tax=Hyalella azteca TaxID=294128 RepID=A0A979FQU4_HYAAZ|nr:uncharacterized protein LOC108665248 isoform X2 [Hyalella azteca]